MKRIYALLLLGIILATLTACSTTSPQVEKTDQEIQFTAPGPNPELGKPAENGKVAGLGTGFWHGLISPVTLIMSFLSPPKEMYEVHNDGPMYNLGYLIGVAIIFIVLGFTGGRRR